MPFQVPSNSSILIFFRKLGKSKLVKDCIANHLKPKSEIFTLMLQLAEIRLPCLFQKNFFTCDQTKNSSILIFFVSYIFLGRRFEVQPLQGFGFGGAFRGHALGQQAEGLPALGA